MMKSVKWLRGIAAAAILFLAGPVFADDDNGFSEHQTKRAVDTFEAASAACATLDPVFRVDCLRQAYSQTVRVVANASVYWEAEVALTRVNRGLYAFVREHLDRSVARVRVNGGRIKAVTPASVPLAQQLYRDGVDRAVAAMRGASSLEVRYFEPISQALLATKSMMQ
ncbi:hypothetical protein J7413_11655 [Shimia sp. R10_1]|uniref:hypothetical protein n=1 Tax=Shimia sp. R10_1 TaxID=2821095 RepID=UPI001AD97936|nr:hypothetical protein [Shimia sp. R10_1]MBO9474195.1 hypothetical protein [Shimia sp. R10_1]